MMFWVLLICLLIVIAIGVLVYRQDNRLFSQLTGYSLFDILLKPKASYFNKVMNQLEGIKGTYKVLLDVTIPTNNTQRYIDAIVIHESGIFVMTGVQKKGWITGAEHQPEWIESLHKGQVNFLNPIAENKRSVYALQELLPEVNEDVFSSIIVFSDACSIQKIEVTSQDVDILKLQEIKAWSQQMAGEILTQDEMTRIYQVLEPYMSYKAVAKQGLTKPITN